MTDRELASCLDEADLAECYFFPEGESVKTESSEFVLKLIQTIRFLVGELRKTQH